MGALHNGSGAMMTNYKGVPFVYCHNGIGNEGTGLADKASAMYSHATERMAGYNFSAYRTVCWSPTGVRQMVNTFDEYAAEKGLKTQYVELHTLLALAKESGQGYEIKK